MTFSEFAKMLYSCIGENQKSWEFVIHLTNQIMENPIREQDKQKDIDDEYNPLSKLQPNTLTKIYNGTRCIRKKNARIILSHLDKEKFNEYLSSFSPDTIDLIGFSLQEKGITFAYNETIDECTNLFVSILQECAQRDTAHKESEIQQPSPNILAKAVVSDTCNIGAQIYIPDKYKNCAFCTRWKGDLKYTSKSETGIWGICMLHNKEMFSTEGIDCKLYEPKYGKITIDELLSK